MLDKDASIKFVDHTEDEKELALKVTELLTAALYEDEGQDGLVRIIVNESSEEMVRRLATSLARMQAGIIRHMSSDPFAEVQQMIRSFIESGEDHT